MLMSLSRHKKVSVVFVSKKLPIQLRTVASLRLELNVPVIETLLALPPLQKRL